MENQGTIAYAAPTVVDYGTLQELTAACLGGKGGDAAYPSNAHPPFGVSSPGAGICREK